MGRSGKHRRGVRKGGGRKDAAQDGSVFSPSGSGSLSDLSMGKVPIPSFLPVGSIGLRDPDPLYHRMWQTQWEAAKIVEIPPHDMVREGWHWVSEASKPEAIKAIERLEQDIGLHKVIQRALEYERAYGGGVVLIGTKEDVPLGVDVDSAKQMASADPLDVSRLGLGDLVFVRALPRNLVAPLTIDTNPMSPDYYRPEIYMIGSSKVHRSRLLVFDGGGDRSPGGMLSLYGLTDIGRRQDGFGTSKLQLMYDDIMRAVSVRQSIAHLVEMVSIPIFRKKNIQNTLAMTVGGEKAYDVIFNIMRSMSNHHPLILGSDEEIEQYTANLNDIKSLMIEQLQVLSAASDIPATRFIGQAPGGLNATGEGDLRNYYDSIKSQQVNKLAPALNKLQPILAIAATGRDIPDLTVKFNPLMQLTEVEQADARAKDWTVIKEAVESKMGDLEWAWKEALERNIFLNESNAKGRK